jgi:Transposase and inactivated derivatives
MRAPKRSGVQPQLFQIIDMDALVPERHILRRLDEVIDWSVIHPWISPLYSETMGRPAADPELMVRLMLLSYLFNHSERNLYATLPMHAGYLWFCGLDFESVQNPEMAELRLPDRTTLVKTRNLWRENGIFDDLMRHVVDQCIAAGLVKTGVDAAVDGSQIRANVSIHSLEEIQLAPVESIDEYLARQAKEDETSAKPSKPDKKEPPAPGAGGRKTGLGEQAVHEDFHGKSFSNQTHRSTSDPDARLYKKSAGQEAHPRYLIHDLVDVRSGVILDRRASQASGTAEREVSLEQLAAIRFRHPSLSILTLSADKAYGIADYLLELNRLGIVPLVSLRNLTLEEVPVYQRKTNDPVKQTKREAKAEQIQILNEAKQIQLHGGYRQVQKMRARCEHVFAEAKNIHGLDRSRSRGLDRMQEQATWTAIVQNLKRLCRFKASRPRTGSSVCAKPADGNQRGFAQASFLPFFACFSDMFKTMVGRRATISPHF